LSENCKQSVKSPAGDDILLLPSLYQSDPINFIKNYRRDKETSPNSLSRIRMVHGLIPPFG
jgi:hypothetical protein